MADPEQAVWVSGSALILRADALRLPLPDRSVSLVVCSPPYFALRSYRDGGAHYDGQLGSEPTPQAFLEALWAVMAEVWRVLRDDGSCFVNLGDKRSGSGGHNNASLQAPGNKHAKVARLSMMDGQTVLDPRVRATRRNAPDRYNQAAFGRPKSKMLLPHRFAIGCEDGLADPEGKGWIVRQDIVWSKLNGLPESVTDRCRDSHEFLFHLVKHGDYFAAVDEVREAHAVSSGDRVRYGLNARTDGDARNARSGASFDAMRAGATMADANQLHPLGKLPSSVWPLPSEPLLISPDVKAHYDLPDHFAAFPTELVRRVILGWSPSGICTACDTGVRPVTTKRGERPVARAHRHIPGYSDPAGVGQRDMTYNIGGYACLCRTWTHDDIASARTTARPTKDTTDPTAAVVGGPETSTKAATAELRPSRVLDVFSGSGTAPGVARALGRIGIGVDLSADYCRLAHYLIHRSTRFAKVHARTNAERQGSLIA